MSWLVLGFTAEQVTMAWQDARLAEACVRAARSQGHAPPNDVLQGCGEAPYLVEWYVGANAARLLDACAVDWRRFVVGVRSDVPAHATPALREPATS